MHPVTPSVSGAGHRRLRHLLVVLIVLAALAALPASTLAANPGPPNVEVVPPEVVLTDRGDEPVDFVPGLITFSFSDGSATSCVIDPAAPPNPCSELMSTPGPPDVEVVPPEAIRGEDGGLLGFIPGLILITFADGGQLSCVIDPAVPPNPCSEVVR